MKLPRFSISNLMAVVLIVAQEFGLGKAIASPPFFRMPLTEVLIFGCFPMANILAIGLAVLLVGRNDPGPRRPGLVGFVAFGLAAWLALLACSFLAPQATHDSIRPVLDATGMTPGLALLLFAMALFLAPQLAVAALGWWLGRRHVVRVNVSVERRAPGTTGPGSIPIGEASSSRRETAFSPDPG